MAANDLHTPAGPSVIVHGVSESHTLSNYTLPLSYSFVAYRDASRNGLVLYQLPTIGSIADKWVQEE
jgi:hypothetical protein